MIPPFRYIQTRELTREQLLRDLYRAYLDARKHKRGKPYQLKYEMQLEDNLLELRDALWERRYEPLPSKCFVIENPTLREVFAADFRDRVVHHLYYNYTYGVFDKTFIEDSYSCRKGKGTHYGIERMFQHVKEESDGYSGVCYVLKMDISGYFMHIDRERLCRLALETLKGMKKNYDFIRYITEKIVLLDPTEKCKMFGKKSDWDRLPYNKSLFKSPAGCGLPIGNLTSQVFSNVYMNFFDQWMEKEMECKHYGRYVDDFYVVSKDRRWLVSLVPKIEKFLSQELGLFPNSNKTLIYDARHGVPFLGCFLKEGRVYVLNRSWKRMKRNMLREQVHAGPLRLRSTMNSYLGILKHYKTYNKTRGFLDCK